MALQKFLPSGDAPTMSMKRLTVTSKVREKVQLDVAEQNHDVEVDLREVYFLIMHFLSSGPCQRTCVQLWNELLEHQLLPRRYHAWYSRSGMPSGDEDDSGLSFPLSYNQLVERFPHIENEHLVKLLKQLISSSKSPSFGVSFGNAPNAADVPTLLGKGSFSLLMDDRDKTNEDRRPPLYMRWPHMKANQVQGLRLREIGGGFTRHHRAPSIRAACYAIAKPSTMVQKMQNIKRIRGHRNAVYCATFDRSGRHVITGSDDRLVKIWSMETAYCLASCRGHDGDITDLAVSTNNALVASSSNDCIIRVWRMPDGLPISVLRGHTGAVTAIAFSPRPSAVYQLLSSSDDGTCRIWDARHSQSTPRIYIPRPHDSAIGRSSGPSSSNVPQSHQIFCCAFNASGTIFVTGSSDNLARVWNASKPNLDDSDQPNHEIDVLSGHENDVNYVQFSGCAVASRFSTADTGKEDNIPKFKNSWFNHDNIVTCSRDGSAIIWISKSRRSHGKTCRWTRAYHLRVPPPPMPPQPQRGGPRQRILPTPRGVNMIVWSLDNRFVLAAIMDCRICVWNASDGSLVHSLTGHTDSTYVLDVHPFNPRIAMSAGYDGKTIVWDIWEGKPIRTYDMSHFKLVDGKFSPDGTSIILSDDVGQLYILSTGQGESQNDAKYDQFFLGDYRPLIQDTHGGVLDQETQLVPYRRNMQDLLCDSAMIPYPEPYQTEYQQRRLGALGIEWCPSSLRLAVGPDFSLDPEYQMFPLPDLDMLIEPLPEVIDAMDWEFENEVHSDDTDSEYNINEDNSSGGEKECSSSNASGDPGCSTDDSEGEGTHMDGNHRLKRKKQKTDTEIMTSSGRRVKRRNLDEGADNALSSHRSRRRKSSQKASSRRSSKSKSSRPRRAAARNALHLFSRINGVPTDGEEDSVEGDSSGSESSLLESISDESNRDTHNDHRRYLKGKEVSLNEADDMNIHELPETHTDAVNRRRLVLKLPVRDKSVLESTEYKFENEAEFVASSSKSAQQAIDVNNRSCSEEPQYNSGIVNHYKNDRRRAILQIQWGRVRARSARGKRVGKAASSNANASSVICLNDKQKYVSGYEKEDKDFGTLSPPSEIHKDEDKIDNLTVINENCVASASEPHNTSENGIGPSASGNCRDSKDEALTSDMDAQDTTVGSINHSNGPDHLSESYIGFPSVSTRVRSKRTSRDLESPVKNETKSLVPKSGVFSGTAISDSNGEQNVVLAADNTLAKSNEGDNGVQEINTQDDHNLISHDSQEPQSHQDKMYKAVYRRSRSHRAVSNAGDGSGQGEPTSNGSNIDLNLAVDLINETNEPAHTTYSLDMEQATSNTNHGWNNIIIPHVHVRSPRNGSSSRGQPTEEEHGSSSKTTVGLRSTRNRRVSSNHVHERSPPIRKKSSQSSAKGSWLLLSLPEEGCRYIPQQADEVVYLRQGHQEYIEYRRSRESGPWASLNGQVRAVEYCRIQNLEYSTVPGSGDSCCKLTLQFVDPASSVVGKSFKLSLPEVTGFPDFLVERTRFDAAMTRNWTHRDKCRVWWKSDGEGDFGGSWWDGRILSVKPKSTQFLDSPWERYTIQYKNDPAETHLHSPWELFDADTVWEQPHIDESKRIKLLSAFEKLLQSGNKNQDRYGVRELSKVSNKTKFINRFPVPLTLELIHSRLDNTYYRTLEALEHDMTVLLSNASSFFEKDAVLSGKIMRLSEWFTRTFSSL